MPIHDAAYNEYFAGHPHDVDPQGIRADALPRHIAVIMDGNGRWAQARGLSRSFGHMAGVEGLRELIQATVRLGIPYLTVYAFSTENWNRPQEEVNTLMQLFAEEVHNEMDLLKAEQVKLRFIGDLQQLPDETRFSFEDGLKQTAHHTGTELALAVNYGSRKEIVRACKTLVEQAHQSLITPEDVSEAYISSLLYTAGMADPDLCIRTSGEMRLSNFLLWQFAYTEFYVTDTLWPDFTRYDLLRAIAKYQQRERRFGGLASKENVQ